MKIGLLTLSASDNCGSLLQCYALKRLLQEFGDVEVINFSSKRSYAMYDIPAPPNLLSALLHRQRNRALLAGKRGYDEFRKTQLGINGPEYLANDLNRLSASYDAVVVGSDQVWNVRMYDFDEAFFLGWTKSKKIAYAPSLGAAHLSLSPNFETIKQWLAKFHSLSAREEIGKNCLEEVTGRVIPKTLDPTLAIDSKIWDGLAGDSPIIQGDYIFYYSWAYREAETSRIVSNEGRRLGMPVYVIDPRKWQGRSPRKWGFSLLADSGPMVFLNLMKYAKKAFVESFHGMVFAYLFRKDFWLLDIHEDIRNMDSRLLEFVDLLGIRSQCLTKYNVARLNMGTHISYDENIKLNELREFSKNYLRKALEA